MLTGIDLFDDELGDSEQESLESEIPTHGKSSKAPPSQQYRIRSVSTPSSAIITIDLTSDEYLELNVIKKNIYDWNFSCRFLLFNMLESIALSPHCIISNSPIIQVMSGIILVSYFIHRQLLYASSQRFLTQNKPDTLSKQLVRNHNICYIRRTNQIKPHAIVLFFFRICIEATTITLSCLFVSEQVNHDRLDFYYICTLLLFFSTTLIESVIETGFSILSLRFRSDTNVVGSIPEYFIQSAGSLMSQHYRFFALARTLSSLTLCVALALDLIGRSDMAKDKFCFTVRFLPILWTLFLESNRVVSITEARTKLNQKCCAGFLFQLLNLSYIAHFFRSSGNLATFSFYTLIPFSLLDIGLCVIIGYLLNSPMSSINHWGCELLIISAIELTLFIVCSAAIKLPCTHNLTVNAIQLLSSSAFIALIGATSFSFMLKPYYPDPTGIVFFSTYMIQLLSLGIPRYYNDKILLQRCLFKPQELKTEKLVESKSAIFSQKRIGPHSIFKTAYGATECTSPSAETADITL